MRPSHPIPVVTWVFGLLCVGMFLAQLANSETRGFVYFLGYRSGFEIWQGSWWAIFPPNVLHSDAFHIFFNLYWIAILGPRIEKSLGPLALLLLILGGGAISSIFELAVNDTPGIGASGVVYAMFGFMAVLGTRFPSLRLPKNLILFLSGWLIACFPLTHFEVLKVANWAHVGGVFFGMATALGLFWSKALVVRFAYLIVFLACLVPLFWWPSSEVWQEAQATGAQAAPLLPDSLKNNKGE